MATISSYCRRLSTTSYYIFPDSTTGRKRLICVVCGSMARGYNFGAITCMSCKIFFRRNAFTSLNDLYCRAGGSCEINQQTRKCCTYCRLLTCFRVGMKRELFRIKENDNFQWFEVDKQQQHGEELRLESQSYEKPSNNQFIVPTNSSTIRSPDHFQSPHCFQLSQNDWLLLNKLSVDFDSLNYHIAAQANKLHQRLLSIGIQPLKMRAKASYIYDITNTLTDTGLKFIETIPEFISLPDSNKQALLMRNARSFTMFYTHYQMNLKPMQTILETPYWQGSVEFILSSSTIYLHQQVKYQIGRISLADPYLIKLILVILAFLAHNIDYNDITISQQLDEYYHSQILHRKQNIYVELMWKSMIHRFGEVHTILHFNTIIQTILQSEKLVFTFDNSTIPFEHKFYENVVKSISKILEFKK
ncbi:unnamed protein product [Rotaria socialis]|uniref:Nuclear receptor domain-containing protein n=1 Tax=Rotaria socialis TaxID=392032 RepID=A0A819WYA7_9BILA|nr:unnamed protein product [Rotaria socialis]CAF4132310.1 unnamed protein product [Rotaria socialis]